MRQVAVIGTGLLKWGELWDKSLRDIFVESALNAMDNSKVEKIDSMYVGCMSSGLFTEQEHLASVLGDYLGVKNLPVTRVESACASGGLAFRLGWMDVALGVSDFVLVGGVEKMTDVDGSAATAALATAADQEWEGFNGVTFPGLYAMMAVAHMEKFGTTREQMASVSVKNHDNGALNPNAQFPHKLTLEQVLNSTPVADPLRLFDCSPITDGAASVILCPLDMAKKYTDNPVVITGSGHATDTIALHDREDFYSIPAAKAAAEKAYKMADCKPGDIDFAEVHDCFSIAEIMAVEALGFFEQGQGGKAAENGDTALTGKMPINTSGGLKSKGHPVGATGVAQICELVEQLSGNAGKRQLKDPKRGLAQNMGGSGGSSLVHILEVAK